MLGWSTGRKHVGYTGRKFSFSLCCSSIFPRLNAPGLSYLCVEKGKRITPNQFYADLVRRNRAMFSCGWGARDFRQGMVTLAREFISPSQSFACADDVLAEAADHSSEVDTAHYAVVHGALPRVTNSEMNRHRWLAEEWGSLLGLGPFPPPEPVALVRRKARSVKPTETEGLAAQVPGLVADAVTSSLAALGLTRDAVQMLSRLAERQLDSSLGVQGPLKPPAPSPSPPHPRQSMAAGEVYMDPIEDPDRPSLGSPPDSDTSGRHLGALRAARKSMDSMPGSSPPVGRAELRLLGSQDPFQVQGRLQGYSGEGSAGTNWNSEAQGVYPVYAPAKARRELKRQAPSTPFPAGALDPRSLYQHPFEIPPSAGERLTQATISQMGPSSHRRSAAEMSAQREQSVRPSKRRRLHQIDAQLGSERASGEGGLTLGGNGGSNSANKMQLSSDGGDGGHSTDEDEDYGDDSADDLPLCEAAMLAGTQTLTPSRGEGERAVVKNVTNPRMFGESTLQGNIRHAMQELVHKRDAREKSLAQMLAIVLVMRRSQDAMVTMRTGGGKSMLWMVPPLLDPKVKLLVVCPFKVLLEEQFSKAKKANIRALAFSAGVAIPTNTQILFVQVEHVGSKTLTE